MREDKPEAVAITPFKEIYDWGEIGFDFYEGWIEDIRGCAAGLRNRILEEAKAQDSNRKCNSADRLLAAICSDHYDQRPPPKPNTMRCAYCDRTLPWDTQNFPSLGYAQCWRCYCLCDWSHLPFCLWPGRGRRYHEDSRIYRVTRWLGRDWNVELEGTWRTWDLPKPLTGEP